MILIKLFYKYDGLSQCKIWAKNIEKKKVVLNLKFCLKFLLIDKENRELKSDCFASPKRLGF